MDVGHVVHAVYERVSTEEQQERSEEGGLGPLQQCVLSGACVFDGPLDTLST